MSLKELLFRKKIKQVYLVKQLGVDPARVSLQINGIRNLPIKYFEKLATILGISTKELARACKFSDPKQGGK